MDNPLFAQQPSPDVLALVWLRLAMADPRALMPHELQMRNQIHQALNQRMQRDPYGIVSLTPPGPSFLQQRLNFQQQHPPAPFQEAFPLPNWPRPFFGSRGQPAQQKTGVTFEPEGTRWGI
ncbi:MAG: hypothetical protein CV089_20240 [Nitrospira sp. WS110]|nr:hypothetical protein [Nitrospira sp. WS110]